jgi:hypothetical protein
MYGLSNDAVTISVCVASNVRMMVNGEVEELRKQAAGTLPALPRRNGKNHKIGYDSRCPDPTTIRMSLEPTHCAISVLL